jgi:hypothetical protein
MLTVRNSTFTNNAAAGDGGALENNHGLATFTGSSLSGNTSLHSGGGLNNDNWGVLTVLGSSLSRNSALEGGGLYNQGLATVSDSTLSGNTAAISGGGIANSGTLTVNSSFLLDNTAQAGGGLYNSNGVVLNVNDSTLLGNSAYDLFNDGGEVNTTNSTIGTCWGC